VNGSFVLGFDHDGPDVFERTAHWIEANRLECATFHILTPYPATPLYRQLELEDRPGELGAVLPYLAMSYLDKRSNRFWHFLIK
jgi:hypothetical protein